MGRRIAVEIVGDASSLERSYKKAARSTKGFEKNIEQTGKRGSSMFKGLGRGIGLATGALGVAGFAGAAHAAFSEMADAQKVSAQTTAVLKSTGGAANVSAGQVDTLANSLMRKSGIDDEAIKSGENLLLTFTNIRNEVGKGNDIFNQATSVITDMSTALGQDMKSSAIQVGKALNDPIKGVGALRRVGVQFTKAQEKQIKTLVATGHTLDAQKLILRELNKEFGGSAEAAGKTLPGKLNILKETLLNLGGSIAETLTPTITRLVDKMVAWLSNSKNQQQVLNLVKSAAAALTTVLKILSTAFNTLSKLVGGSTNAIKLLIAAFVAWKAVQMASAVSKVASSFGLLTAKTAASTKATRGATVASRGLAGSFLGKAGLVAGAGLAAYELTTLALKATGLDKKLNALGATAFDAAAKLGLVNDPGKQFAGKTNLDQAAAGFVRRRARRLETGGMSPEEAAARIARTHPNLAKRDIGVLAGVGVGGIVINGGVHLHDINDVPKMENEIFKRAKTRPTPRRGT